MRTDFQTVLVEQDEGVVLTGAGRAFGAGQDLTEFGSANIALACDMRVAADNARLGEGFARIGLVPDGGGGYTLPRLIGLGRALEMALLADEVSGVEAERIGLVNSPS